jgi:hypothetical protein
MKKLVLALVLAALALPLAAQPPAQPAGPPKIQTLSIPGQLMGHDW